MDCEREGLGDGRAGTGRVVDWGLEGFGGLGWDGMGWAGRFGLGWVGLVFLGFLWGLV